MSVIKPNIPKGTRDFSANILAKRDYLKDNLISIFKTFGFQPLETPSFERSETLLGKYGEEGDRLIFKILNSGEKIKQGDIKALENGNIQKFSKSISQKALRYDLTVPLARYVAQNQNDIKFPFRRYQIQNVWRADRPQNGRFREFLQCDADVVGEPSLWQEVEGILLYDRVFSKLNLKGIKIKINHRKILTGIAELIGAKSQLIDFTIALDKLAKIGEKGVIKELLEKGFEQKTIDRLKPFLSLNGDFKSQLSQVESALSSIDISNQGIDELKFVYDQLAEKSLDVVSLDFDSSLARGLNYYTGLILEVIPPKDIRIGSIGGGGRYDNLTNLFGLKNTSGFGISFGFDRIFLVLEQLNLFPETLQNHSHFLFLNFGDKYAEFSFKKLSEIRDRQISCEFYPKEVKLKKQMNYADQQSIPFVVIIGPEEIKNDIFMVKDMRTGDQSKYSISSIVTTIEKLSQSV